MKRMRRHSSETAQGESVCLIPVFALSRLDAFAAIEAATWGARPDPAKCPAWNRTKRRRSNTQDCHVAQTAEPSDQETTGSPMAYSEIPSYPFVWDNAGESLRLNAPLFRLSILTVLGSVKSYAQNRFWSLVEIYYRGRLNRPLATFQQAGHKGSRAAVRRLPCP